MTTIAYKDGVLACDSAWNVDGSTVITWATKITRLPSGALYAGAGDSDDRELVALLSDLWLSAGTVPARAALADLKGDYSALLVFPSEAEGGVWLIEKGDEDSGAMRVVAPFAAIGAGRDIALGAMAAGASAEEAVRIACRFNTQTREPVFTETIGAKA